MNKTKELLDRTENFLAHLEALQNVVDALREEIKVYQGALQEHLAMASTPAPAVTPVATPPVAPAPASVPELPAARPEPEPPPVPPAPEPPPRRKLVEPPPIRLAPAAGASPAELKAQHGKERRASLRRKGNPVSVLVMGGDSTQEPLTGWIVDRSMGGVCVLTDEEFPAGTQLAIRPATAPETFSWIHTAVRSCRQERGSYKLGLQFVQAVTWEELRMFG